ncbi:MAG: DUF4160 domain-containing protein [Oscillospiraceae bacterium]|nr:DUF4160 domain-containing protein [Oscillospiraceae bacterium]MCI9581137.1 DUF4160 domain-containing protein [Oscillospiraceae bacterium]
MPKLYTLRNGYIVSIWSNENGEEIHVHISKRKPSANSTKFWLLENGEFVLAHNRSRIPEQDLNYIKAFLNANSEEIRNSWIAYHGYEKYRTER